MKKIIKICIFTIICLISVGIILFPKVKKEEKKVSAKDLINISELSDEFMNNYYEGVKAINESGNEDNVLLVISEDKIEDSYGASSILEAPNNLYILEYSSESKKENAYSKLKEDKSLISVEKNDYSKISVGNYNSWGIEAMSLDYATEVSNNKNLQPVTVAIIDTGCDVELADKYYNGKMSSYYNVLDNSSTEMSDENGHGTHIYGTIAEGTPSNVKIMPVKVSRTSSISRLNIITAINYVTDNNVDVVNMSFGGTVYNQAEEQAIEAARQKNIICVAAAGNSNSSANHYPSSLDNTISIASVDSSLNKSNFSNYGSTITFAAPGTNIRSIMGKNAQISKDNGNNDDDEHEIISGTSMATPHAVAAVAILKGYNKDITIDNTIDLLKTKAIDLGDKSWDRYFGYGLISFSGAEFCDGISCDAFNVFKKDSELSVKKIEIPNVSLTSYNYGSIYNLLSTDIRLYYTQDQYTTKKLWELIDYGLEIDNYNPYAEGEQEVEIKYAGFNKTVTVPYPTNYNSNIGWEYNILNENDIEITLYKDNLKDIKKLYIPETIDGYNVTSIAGSNNSNSMVFMGSADYSKFEEIILPKKLTNLGKRSLASGNYTKIKSLANGIYIGEYALASSFSLEEIDATITGIGRHSFHEAKSLKTVNLPDDITEIPDGAFEMCTNLENINLPSNLISIGNNAFADDYKITKLTLPNGLKLIKYSASFLWNKY